MEEQVKAAVLAKGFQSESYRKYRRNPDRFGDNLLLTDYSYGPTIYGRAGSAKFLLLSHDRNLRIVIECKWQQGRGSVDHKLPYLYLNLLESVPENRIIIVIDGDGWGEGAIAWLKNAASTRKYADDSLETKKISVMSLKEFITWVNDTIS